MKYIKSYSRNLAGRDFVVGDIHGCYDQLMDLLKEIKFDFAKDRMFAVGDLVDRGPKSKDVLELLYEPWFHSVIGNHDYRFICYCDALFEDANKAIVDFEDYLSGEGSFIKDLKVPEMIKYYRLIDSFPNVIEVETLHSKFGIVHAESLSDWDLFKIGINSNYSIRTNSMWARKRFYKKDESIIDGIDYVIVGHTVVDEPIQLGNTIYIDTGCVFSNERKLTCMCLNNMRMYSV